MGNQERIKKLTWKYFLEQKAQELLKGVLWVSGGIVAPLIIGFQMGIIFKEPIIFNSILLMLFFTWLIGLLGLLFLLMIGLILYVIFIDGLWDWVKSNWERAKRRAQNEVNKKSKGGKK